jgi:hypothetical protein
MGATIAVTELCSNQFKYTNQPAPRNKKANKYIICEHKNPQTKPLTTNEARANVKFLCNKPHSQLSFTNCEAQSCAHNKQELTVLPQSRQILLIKKKQLEQCS